MERIEYIDREIIRTQWDDFAPSRHRQIVDGKDLSFSYVLVPIIMRLIKDKLLDNVLDIGCGTGVLTKELSKISKHVVGIDPSKISIDIARKFCKENNNISFEKGFIEDYNVLEQYSVAISNMVIMDACNIEKIFQSISRLLFDNAYFIFTITHPCFWPQYWGYNTKMV
jgi:2-polyprenyl-3-methyl-5-hydroxy-6-metoxy-1,4-benzoquinol methylase